MKAHHGRGPRRRGGRGARTRAARSIHAGVIQLHGEEPTESSWPSCVRWGAWKLWKAVRARSPDDDVLRTVDRYADVADGILVEGWKEGVTGRRWSAPEGRSRSATKCGP